MTALAFVGRRPLLYRADGGDARLPTADELVATVGATLLEEYRVQVLVRDEAGHAISVHQLDDDTPIARVNGVGPEPLRGAWSLVGSREFRLLSIARQKLDWLESHRFCSRCATPTRPDEMHEALTCPACRQTHYPRIAPAVIVLVQRGREALLGRSPHFAEGVYSTLAGFVEPGETLEECVHREILEEVGVRVHDLRYFGSQSHPFPHSLMVGFVAEWLEGELRVDREELEDARWFDVDELPLHPHPRSISFALIRDFEERARGGARPR